MEIFSPPRPPGYQSGQQVEYRIRRVDFGDGYAQRAGDGINTDKRVWTLEWAALLPAECDAIVAFLTARGGHESFLYTVPGDVQRVYTCPSWTMGLASHATRSLQAKFQEEHDL